ncbi:NET1-associated nuclear protein 1 [Kickxella alabastrina]|uniref:NET1-associated nuclear protein 1 n=1 Tax=Kickxella alabastrina TaxID=61397 RepID=A0ACC1IM80_9FUNG|nr:NET1-associated nuclear protein 1 [Kickxella alabastrina]
MATKEAKSLKKDSGAASAPAKQKTKKTNKAPKENTSEAVKQKSTKSSNISSAPAATSTATTKTSTKKRPPKLVIQHGHSDSEGEGETSSHPMTPMTPMVQSAIAVQDTEAYRGIELKLVSGGLLTNDSVVFSSDSALFYVAKDDAVAVYNVQNGEMVQNFSMERSGTGYQPTAVHAIVAGEARRVYTFSADARARLWDADSGAMVSEWDLGEAAVFASADPARAGAFYCAVRRGPKAVARQGNDKVKYAICHVVLGEGEATTVRELFVASGALGLVVRPGGGWVAAYSKFRVFLAQIKPSGAVVQHKWRMSERLSALAFHPTEPVLAVGDWRGRIMHWFCVDGDAVASEDRSIVRRPLHWHAHKVNAVVFGSDGRLMLSGGEEGVLVLWQMGSDTREFLPRLGSDILGIAVSPDQMMYALTLRDNTVRVVSALDRSMVSTLQGLKFAQRGQAAGLAMQNGSPERLRLARRLEPDAFTTGLVVHPATHALVLNGEPGHLQVFNHATDRHLASIEVAAFNRISGSNAEQQQPHVDIVQFSSDGVWMATADSRGADSPHGPSALVETYLKFWRLDSSDQSYKLVTRVDAPHARGVRALAFRPAPRRAHGRGDGLLCVSTGRDGTFRVWELETRQGAPGAEDHYVWSCRSTLRFRGLQPSGAAFSADGSTLAVAFGGVVTLWDADTCAAPVFALVASAATPDLAGVAFIGSSNYVAAWSDNRLDVWNMLTGSVWWTLAMPLQSVYAHPRASLLAVAANQIPGQSIASIMVLDPQSPVPLITMQHSGGVEAIALAPAATSGKSGRSHPDTERGLLRPDPLQNNSLVVLTPTGLLNVYGAESDDEAIARAMDAAPATSVSTAAVPMQSSAFASIFGAQNKPAADSVVPLVSANPHVRSAMRLVRSAVQSAYINAPHHVLPPVSALYDQFVKAHLAPRVDIALEDTAAEEDQTTPDPNKMDISSDDDMAAQSVLSVNVETSFSSGFTKSLCSGFASKTY